MTEKLIEKHIAFRSLDDLLRFLLARQASGRTGQTWNRVFVHKSSYAVNFTANDWDGIGDRFGGEIGDSSAPGKEVEINHLLQLVPLQRVPSNYNAGSQSLVLAVPVDNQVDSFSKQEMLYEAWGKVERVDSARSAFYSCKSASGKGWHAVRIDGVLPTFDYEKFHEANFAKFDGEGLRLLAPAWTGGGCFLFVEWEYRYPKLEQFAQLYRDTSGELLLCLAANAAEVGDARGSWWTPSWHVLEGGGYYTTSDLFEVTALEKVETVRYPTGQGHELSRLRLRLEIGTMADLVASPRELESRIGALESELEYLNAKQERISRAGYQQYYAIYLWVQQSEAAVPPGLEHLLSRPLSELSRHLYLRCDGVDGSILHYVASKDQQRAGVIQALSCDRLYLCDSRWQVWDLPLYIPRDMALSIDINEEGMAAVVRDALPSPDSVNGDAEGIFCVAEPSNDESRTPKFVWLPFSQSLDSALALTNDGASGAAAAVRSARHDANHAAIANDIALSDAMSRLDLSLRQRTEEKLRTCEEAWEKIRRELQTASFQTRLAEIATQPLARAHTELAESWNQFVARTLSADAVAAHFKLEQLGIWQNNDPERREQLARHDAALTDVQRVIQERNSQYDALCAQIEERNQMLKKHLTDLDAKLVKLRGEQTKLETRAAELNSNNVQLRNQIETVAANSRSVEAASDQAAQLKRDLETVQLREEQLGDALEMRADELENSIDAFGRRLQEAHARKKQAENALPFFRRLLRSFRRRGKESA